jgi:hypothetical protein
MYGKQLQKIGNKHKNLKHQPLPELSTNSRITDHRRNILNNCMLRCCSIGHHISPHNIFNQRASCCCAVVNLTTANTEVATRFNRSPYFDGQWGCKLFAYCTSWFTAGGPHCTVSLHDVSISVSFVYLNTFEV